MASCPAPSLARSNLDPCPWLASCLSVRPPRPQSAPHQQQRAFAKSIQLSHGVIKHLSSVAGKYICVSGDDGAVR